MAAEQTTASSDTKALLKIIGDQNEVISDQNARIKALEKKKEFLESVLHERFEATKKRRYDELKGYFSSVRDKVFSVFLENGEYAATHGFTHEEIVAEFGKKYPAIPTTNIPRRVRELVEEKKIWAAPDPETGKAVFRLKLEKQRKKSD
jgi:hypothetical protein